MPPRPSAGGALIMSRRLLQFINLAGALIAALIVIRTGMTLPATADDSTQYHQAARNVLETGDPYATMSSQSDRPAFPNPPLLAYLFLPLAPLPTAQMRLVWYTLNSLGLAALLWACLRAAPSGIASRWWGIVALAAVSAPPTYLGLILGQLGILLSLLTVAAFLLARARPAAAGLALALGALIKLYPAFAALYFLRHGPRRPVWWSLPFGAALAAVPLAAGGLLPYEQYVRKVLLGNFYPYAAEFNSSLVGFFSRLLTTNEYVVPLANQPSLARAATLAGSLAVLGMCAWLRSAPDALGRLTVFAVWICAMQLLTPLNGYYNLVALLLPALALLACLERYPSAWAAAVAAIATAALYIPPGWSRMRPELLAPIPRNLETLVLTPSVYSVCAYLALLAWFARRHARVAGP